MRTFGLASEALVFESVAGAERDHVGMPAQVDDPQGVTLAEESNRRGGPL